MSWLDDIVISHSELESPASFWKWSALAAISAVVKDNIWLPKPPVGVPLYKLYPNIYVMLHADSGLKKGPPVNMAKRLVKKVNNTTIISGRSSIQGILKEMGTGESAPGGQIKRKSTVFICSSELSSSIVDDKAAMDILTDLFDRHYNEGNWRSLLKMESFSLTDATVTMLTATNEAHSSEFFLRKDVQGGYFARTFIIHETETKITNSLMFELKNPPNDDQSAEYLKQLSTLKGPFQMDLETRKYFDDWYIELRKISREFTDTTGTLNRFDDSVLKVAMLISLGRAPELIIHRSAIEEAIEECHKLMGNVRQVTFTQKEQSNYAQHQSMILKELFTRENHMISRQQLVKKFGAYALVNEWDEVMGSLEVSGAIKIENQGNVVVYRMDEKTVKELRNHFTGK